MVKTTLTVKEVQEGMKAKNLAHVNEMSAPVHPKVSWYSKHGKRVVDLCVGIPAFIISLPVNLIIGLVTFFDVGRPIIFKQTRTGKDGKPFTLYKFRNMRNTTDENGNLLPPSQRVTKWGKFVRKTSLDELLNFYSIVKGDMSVIGPRPLPTSFDPYYSERHKMKFCVRPGLECPTLHDDGSIRHYDKQLENDIWYVENISFWIDIRLFFRLFQMVFNRKQRKYHANVDGGDFVGYDDSGNAVNYRTALEEKLLERNRC